MISALLTLFRRNGNGAASPETEPVTVQLVLDKEGTVQLVLGGAAAATPAAAVSAAEPAEEEPAAPEGEDLLVRVQLQESFSPGKAVHLILLPTSKGASHSLTHDVGEWLDERGSSEQGGATEQTPGKSLVDRLVGKMSPGAKPSGTPKPWSVQAVH